MKRKNKDYQEDLFKSLKNHDEALAYLNAALADEDPRVFLLALKDVCNAQGLDITTLAEESGLNRQNIYRMLSNKGNPRWDSIRSIINTIGLEVQLAARK